MIEELKKFLERTDIQEALASYNFKYIYDKLRETFSIASSATCEFTELMLSVGYNPLNYMTYVPKYFLYNSDIKEFKIPDHIKSIGDYAFGECSNLISITIPNSVTSIGEFAFSSCSNLTSITIPNSVTSIEDGAFYYCNNLETVYYSGTKEDWDKIEIDNSNEDLLNAEIIFKK